MARRCKRMAYSVLRRHVSGRFKAKRGVRRYDGRVDLCSWKSAENYDSSGQRGNEIRRLCENGSLEGYVKQIGAPDGRSWLEAPLVLDKRTEVLDCLEKVVRMVTVLPAKVAKLYLDSAFLIALAATGNVQLRHDVVTTLEDIDGQCIIHIQMSDNVARAIGLRDSQVIEAMRAGSWPLFTKIVQGIVGVMNSVTN
jgi:hypothetical protein